MFWNHICHIFSLFCLIYAFISQFYHTQYCCLSHSVFLKKISYTEICHAPCFLFWKTICCQRGQGLLVHHAEDVPHYNVIATRLYPIRENNTRCAAYQMLYHFGNSRVGIKWDCIYFCGILTIVMKLCIARDHLLMRLIVLGITFLIYDHSLIN